MARLECNLPLTIDADSVDEVKRMLAFIVLFGELEDPTLKKYYISLLDAISKMECKVISSEQQ